MKLLITGGNGLVGSRVVDILKEKHEFEILSRQTGCDITDMGQVLNFFQKSEADIVIHMAAKADVDGCEDDKENDQKELAFRSEEQNWTGKYSAYAINAYGTGNVAKAAKSLGKRLIYISTDFVFDGEKDQYTEEDSPNPINWYAKTKYEGEKEVEKELGEFTIARIAYPYRAEFPKKDFVRAIVEKLSEGKEVNAVTDHIMTPTFVDDIASALDMLVSTASHGIFHMVGSSSVSPYEACVKIAELFDFDRNLILKSSRSEYFKNRAPRPMQLSLKNDKIARLGVNLRTFDEGLLEIQQSL